MRGFFLTVKIVTDSTADLPDEIVQSLGITVVPLYVNFGDETYLDGVDLKADEFYEKLIGNELLPTTSQPTPAAFTEVYSNLSKETDEIVSIHISQKLSGTHNSATLGKENAEGNCRIEIIDSLMASMGLGLIVIRAAELAQRGASFEEVVGMTQKLIARTHFFGMVDTLEYLHKGGRIGKAQAFMGTLLSIKPIIACECGEVHPKGKARTRNKAMSQLFDMAWGFGEIEGLTVAHSTVPEQAESLIERLSPLFDKDKIIQSRIGPVIGTYLGPGSIAVGVIVKHF